jgi:retron-type reverse transcriptase
VSLIEEIYKNQEVKMGSHTVKIARGVLQGGVLSPLLFNMYLDEALKSYSLLKELIK